MIQPLDSARNTGLEKSTKLSIGLKEHIIDLNKLGKSLGAVSKQLQVLISTVQTAVCWYKVHGTAVALQQSENINYHVADRKPVRMVKSQPRTTKRQVCIE